MGLIIALFLSEAIALTLFALFGMPGVWAGIPLYFIAGWHSHAIGRFITKR